MHNFEKKLKIGFTRFYKIETKRDFTIGRFIGKFQKLYGSNLSNSFYKPETFYRLNQKKKKIKQK